MNRRTFLQAGLGLAVGAGLTTAARAQMVPWDSEEPFVFKKPTCPVIDARLRPRWGEFLKTFPAAKSGSAYAHTGWTMQPSVAEESEELMLKEMDEAGITMGLAMKRNIPNDSLVKMQGTSTGAFGRCARSTRRIRSTKTWSSSKSTP